MCGTRIEYGPVLGTSGGVVVAVNVVDHAGVSQFGRIDTGSQQMAEHEFRR